MGGDFDHRWTQTREAILVMKELWTKAEAEYHGKYYDFPLVRSYPKPAQKPHPPVILGGHAKTVLERIAEWGDGWLPNRTTPEAVAAARAKLDTLAKQAGRDPKAISISVFGQPPDRDLARRFHDAAPTASSSAPHLRNRSRNEGRAGKGSGSRPQLTPKNPVGEATASPTRHSEGFNPQKNLARRGTCRVREAGNYLGRRVGAGRAPSHRDRIFCG
jgi:alkanesulfonate monooxygenase SsuD/methylene tetrahydromethanopterin reductase-like flavin-dependent oxidoreductase (luciferase family)